MRVYLWVLLVAMCGAFANVSQAVAAEPEANKLDKILKDYTLEKGFFHLHRKKQSVLLEVPRSSIGKPFLLATSVSGGSTMAGFQWSDALVEWQRLDDKLLLVEKNMRYRARQGDPLHEVVTRTYTDRVIKAVKILGEARGGSRGVVVDGSELFGRYAHLFFGDFAKGLDANVARVSKDKVFPRNIELALTMPMRGDGQLVTLHYSMIALPSGGYATRPADDRVGYFLTAAKDFTKPGSGDRFVRYINRWRLEKADPNLTLSPPKRQIIFYIESTVPVRYRRFVEAGILEWNKAFEAIGFVNAVEARQQTEHEFADLDPEDARYSFFRWITSESAFAMGPSRVNPMTGEIFDADIIFDDSMVRSYLRDYELLIKSAPGALFTPDDLKRFERKPRRHPFYGTAMYAPEAAGVLEAEDAAQAAANRGVCSLGEGRCHELSVALVALARRQASEGEKPEGEKEEGWPEDFLGAMIKEVVMHEVGHTLGLRHNFVASTWKPLADINATGAQEPIVASVMDYNPLHVSPPGDQQGQYVTSTLGPYDFWAIAYGYKGVKSVKELQAHASAGAKAGLHFATDEDTRSADPYVKRWDLGADPLAFAASRVKLAKALLPGIEDRVLTDGDSYSDLRRAVDMLVYDMLHAGSCAVRFVGGERYHRSHKGDPEALPAAQVVPAAKQREALAFVAKEFLAEGALKLSPELVSLLGASRWSHWGSRFESSSYDVVGRLGGMQRMLVGALLSGSRLRRVHSYQFKAGKDAEPFTVADVFTSLTNAIFSELALTNAEEVKIAAIDPLRRDLHQTLLAAWIDLVVEDDFSGPPICRALAFSNLQKLYAVLAKRSSDDVATAAHLGELKARARKALDAAFVIGGNVEIYIGGGSRGSSPHGK